MSQWVQSKYSKDARKWEVCSEADKYYNVKDGVWASSLLKSEYIPCDPPELWEICTRDSVEVESTALAEKALADVFADCTRV